MQGNYAGVELKKIENSNASRQQPMIDNKNWHGDVDKLAQRLTEAESKCKRLSAPSSQEQLMQFPHTINCNVTGLSISK